MTFFCICLSTISYYNQKTNESENKILALSQSKKCMAIIDSFFSNSADNYLEKIDCFVENNKVISVIESEKKSFEVLTEIKKEINLEVKTNEHYFK